MTDTRDLKNVPAPDPSTPQASERIPCLELGVRLTAQEAPAVAAWLEQAAQAAPHHVVVNLGDVTCIDGVGLQTLVQGLQHIIDAAMPPRPCAPSNEPTPTS